MAMSNASSRDFKNLNWRRHGQLHHLWHSDRATLLRHKHSAIDAVFSRHGSGAAVTGGQFIP